MTYLLGRDEKHRDLIYGDDYRAYLITRNDSAGDYRFGRSYGKRDLVRVRSALRRVNGFFKNLIAAIADRRCAVCSASSGFAAFATTGRATTG
jgi:hypothetical protein